MWDKSQMKVLSGLFGRFNSFPSGNREDEFVITREDGTRQGIFKEWAPPILPYLSGRKIAEWQDLARKNPAFLEKELRRSWRNSWLIDRDLITRFSKNPLREDPRQKVSQLVNRLKLSFGLMAPFYNLEAIVDDPEWLGIKQTNLSKDGSLDVVAFILPSAFQDFVIATEGNWNGLNWEIIRQLAAEALLRTEFAGALLLTSYITGVAPEQIIFVANALQWIPMRVGGKKNDVGQKRAIRELKKIAEEYNGVQKKDSLSVLSAMNARIRFFNWLPSIEGPENFKGRNWTYASVCDTANDLFETLDNNPDLWKSDFKETYEKILRPQIMNLDASSAKGRLLLDLIINERRLTFDIGKQKSVYKYAREKRFIENATYLFNQPCLVGTKPLGLVLTSYVLGKEHVLPGISLPMDQVNGHSHKKMASEITKRWPNKKLAVRSSSLDESTARGVYETILRVGSKDLEKAIKECIKSYNGKGARAFRKSKGSDDPQIELAVLFQPYQYGIYGGVGTIEKNCNGNRYQISVAKTAEQVTSGERAKEFEFLSSSEAPKELQCVAQVLEKLRFVFERDIQIEWVLVRDNRVIVLQMEFLPKKDFAVNEGIVADDQLLEIIVNSQEDVKRMSSLFTAYAPLRLVIGPQINSRTFQGDLFTAVISLGEKVKEISFSNPISPSSHFANICRHFGIRIV